MDSTMSAEESLGVVSLLISVAMLRALAARGLVSPEEVEAIYNNALDVARHASADVAEAVENRLQTEFAEIRELAKNPPLKR